MSETWVRIPSGVPKSKRVVEGWSGAQGSDPACPLGTLTRLAAGRMWSRNKPSRNGRVLVTANGAPGTKLSPEAMIGPPPYDPCNLGPLVYEVGSLVFTQKNGVRLPGGLPILKGGATWGRSKSAGVRLRAGKSQTRGDGLDRGYYGGRRGAWLDPRSVGSAWESGVQHGLLHGA